MTFIDLVSLISLLLGAVSFFAPSVGRLKQYKREFTAVGFVLFGFVISRVLYTYLPPGHIAEMPPRVIVWGLVLAIMSTVVLVALKQEGTKQAVWAVFIFFMYLSFYGKSVGLIETFKLRNNELLAAAELDERAADFDRAIEVLQSMEPDQTEEGRKALNTRVGILRSRKAERLAHPPSQ